MKQLIVIIGANAVGKSSTAKKIVEQYQRSAFVDSDWCRVINPFILTDITKETVSENIYCLLHNYLICEEISTVIFTYGWHGGRKEIYDRVIERLRNDGTEFQEKIIILKLSLIHIFPMTITGIVMSSGKSVPCMRSWPPWSAVMITV